MNFDSDTNVVEVVVCRLRAKIDDAHAVKLIHTLRGVGYVFEARGEDDDVKRDWMRALVALADGADQPGHRRRVPSCSWPVAAAWR